MFVFTVHYYLKITTHDRNSPALGISAYIPRLILNAVTRILDIPVHIEMGEDNIFLPCLEAVTAASDVDVASSHYPSTHNDDMHPSLPRGDNYCFCYFY